MVNINERQTLLRNKMLTMSILERLYIAQFKQHQWKLSSLPELNLIDYVKSR